MYKGTNKKALTSQKMICHSILDLLKEKSYESITISEICKASGISRQTFYALFKTKENIILHMLRNSYPFILNITEKNSTAFLLKDICMNFSLYINDNYSFLKLLIDNGLREVLFKYFYEVFFENKKMFTEKNYSERDYLASFIGIGLCCIAYKYINRNETVNIIELEELTYSLLSGSMIND
ncbi:MAG: TetR/AcrR family transcriptional regulator [Clostridium sp.]|uniref:TetR/AcrR family transcriptional regulator n=1 Tax=Clostridium sp. TaxID=1506 RepID=UPI003EE734D6